MSNLIEVKSILNIKDNEFDRFLAFCEENISNKILERCNIDIIPKGLNTLIQEFLIEQYTINKSGIGEEKKVVTSISDNGQSANFQVVGGINSMSKNAEEFLDKNMASLVHYRKLRK